MNILVTGADGLLGRQMCEQYSSLHRITALVHKQVLKPVPQVNYMIVDLSRPLDRSVLPKNVDAIFHLAQSSRFREFPEGAKDTFAVNVESTIDLLEYARHVGVKKFFLASTGGVYGINNSPVTESSDLIPPSEIGFYFASKLASEMLSTSYRSVFEVSVLRFFFMYGPGQREDMFLPRLVHKVINEEAIYLAGDMGISVNPIHVNDAAYLMGLMLDRKLPSLLNVSGPDIFSIRQIAELIGGLVNKKPIFEFGSSAQDVLAASDSLQTYFTDRRMTSLPSGLESLVSSILNY